MHLSSASLGSPRTSAVPRVSSPRSSSVSGPTAPNAPRAPHATLLPRPSPDPLAARRRASVAEPPESAPHAVPCDVAPKPMHPGAAWFQPPASHPALRMPSHLRLQLESAGPPSAPASGQPGPAEPESVACPGSAATAPPTPANDKGSAATATAPAGTSSADWNTHGSASNEQDARAGWLCPDASVPPASSSGSGARVLAVSANLPPAMAACTWRLSGYTLVKRLYTGYASSVFLAECSHSCAKVALKVYNWESLAPLHRHQVEREIRIHVGLRHPFIIQLYAAFQEDSLVVLVQEYAAGGDLYNYLSYLGRDAPGGKGCLSERRAIHKVLQPMLLALGYLHAQGILHRDIKLENILVQGRQIKLTDFGLSIDMRKERPVTRVGTLFALAPEVLRCPVKRLPQEGKDQPHLYYGAGADVFSIGVLAYELLVGRPPFAGKTTDEIMESRMETNTSNLPFPDHVSELGRHFITQAMAEDPRERLSVGEMLRHPWLDSFRSAPQASPPPVSIGGQLQQQPRTRSQPLALQPEVQPMAGSLPTSAAGPGTAAAAAPQDMPSPARQAAADPGVLSHLTQAQQLAHSREAQASPNLTRVRPSPTSPAPRSVRSRGPSAVSKLFMHDSVVPDTSLQLLPPRLAGDAPAASGVEAAGGRTARVFNKGRQPEWGEMWAGRSLFALEQRVDAARIRRQRVAAAHAEAAEAEMEQGGDEGRSVTPRKDARVWALPAYASVAYR